MVPAGRRPEKSYFALFICSAMLLFSACSNQPSDSGKTAASDGNTPPALNVPAFNADTAFYFVKKQVDFGSRIPNSPAHVACGDWLAEKFSQYADTVIQQSFRVRAFDGKTLNARNIIASFHPEYEKRILLCSHWDTRPFADQDTERKNEPIDGANDGASGVGVLMEVARQLALSDSKVGVDLILFDVEDYGQPDDSPLQRMQDSYCLGSQYWARNFHVPNYVAQYGILLDMVGGQNVRFTQEGTSMQYAPYIVDKVWKIASATGFSDAFVFEKTKGIIDDHYYINNLAGIRCIDIIHYEYSSPSGFWKHWHTHGDTIDKIDPNSLRKVGQVLLEVLYREGV